MHIKISFIFYNFTIVIVFEEVDQEDTIVFYYFIVQILSHITTLYSRIDLVLITFITNLSVMYRL